MKHLIISREYPPAPYPPGGIGTYVANIARLLAEAGEIVHVIGQRWPGAPQGREELCRGRLIVHRIAPEDPPARPLDLAAARRWKAEIDALAQSPFASRWFLHQAALLAERVIEEDGIDVIEAQEWEAPLFHFMMRRALGLGPARRPPCIVHLHSPTLLIDHFNGRDPGCAQAVQMIRAEAWCIRAADCVIAPSRYLARQCETLYQLPAGSVPVIPYPIGDTHLLRRDPETWSGGGICFVGRLEPRKGVIEWVDAAVRVASLHDEAHFDFVGSDMPAGPSTAGCGVSMRQLLEGRIPDPLRPRFRFHGSVPRAQLPQFLGKACAGVVPSRWENFPNTCIEAMCGGLPVIATRLGGMAEMVEDGVTGWLAAGEDLATMVDGLAEALCRCLATSGEQRRAMGLKAAAAVREQCDNARTVERHVELRAWVAEMGVPRSGGVPGFPTAPVAPISARSGIGVVLRIGRGEDGAGVLASLAAQVSPPRVLVVVTPQPPAKIPQGAHLIASAQAGARAWGEGWRAAKPASPSLMPPAGWVFLDAGDRLEPDALMRFEGALAAQPSVGLVACWTGRGAGQGLLVPYPPALPYQWMANEAPPATAYRHEALPPDPFPSGTEPGMEHWDLSTAVLAAGWAGAVLPVQLATRMDGSLDLPWTAHAAIRATRTRLLHRHPALVARHAAQLLDTYLPVPVLPPPLVSPPASRISPQPRPLAARVLGLLRDPRRLGKALGQRARGLVPAWRN